MVILKCIIKFCIKLGSIFVSFTVNIGQFSSIGSSKKVWIWWDTEWQNQSSFVLNQCCENALPEGDECMGCVKKKNSCIFLRWDKYGKQTLFT